MIEAILDGLGIESLADLFAEAERLECENRELYAYIVENDEKRRTFIRDITRLDKEHGELVRMQAEAEDAKKARADELNKHIGMMQEQLAQIQSQKRKDEIEFSVVYSALEGSSMRSSSAGRIPRMGQ
jgi:seryl-tRNA synthetase